MPRNRIIINILYLFHLLDRYLNLISSTCAAIFPLIRVNKIAVYADNGEKTVL